ncbi:MAG: sel1 repeat family protein [Gammaproteobacteria bacterium]|nr:sel1 repeat family protein [Gammaproteobacteria bacterium]
MSKYKCIAAIVVATLMVTAVSPLMAAAKSKNDKAVAADAMPKVGSFSKEVFTQCPKLKEVMTGSPVDIARLSKFANQPANTCSAYAQYTLGQFYTEGHGGVVQSYTKGASWYRKSANQGNADAQYALGWLYIRGEGVIQNDAQAVSWWRKSALGGNSSAQFFLAWAYNKGKGVAKNNVEAYAWLSVAVAYGVGSDLDITQQERDDLQQQATQMRDQIGALLAKKDAKQHPPGKKFQQAKALASKYYQQTMTHATAEKKK